MKKISRIVGYGILGSSIIIIDQITKFCAISWCQDRCEINQFLSFDIAFNRGISWSLLHTENSVVFCMVSLAIGLLTMLIAWHGIQRFLLRRSIFGEICIVAGSMSNLIDRAYYHGVVDFIVLSFKHYSWPVFNLADTSIVIGVFVMIMGYYKT